MTLQLKATNKESAGDYVVLEEDTYDASYQRYEEFTGEFGPALKLFFTVAYADEQGKTQYAEISGIASLPQDGYLGQRSKLRQWIEAMMGRPLADGESPDMGKLVQSPCRLVLGIKENKREDGTVARFNRIEKILPPRKRATKPVQQEDLV